MRLRALGRGSATLFLALGWLQPAFAVHDIDSAFNAFRTQPVLKNLLLVKLKNNESSTRTSSLTEGLDLPVVRAPVFPNMIARLQRLQSTRTLAVRPPKLENYSYLQFDHVLSDAEALQVLRVIYSRPEVELAYFEIVPSDAIQTEQGTSAPLSTKIPDFESMQFHLNPAPVGIDARYAWTVPGGAGAGIRVLDFETGWISDHVEFKPTFWSNANNGRLPHGTAVWGEIAAKRDGVGTTGIAYDVSYGTAGTGFNGGGDYTATATRALDEAVSHLTAGDLLVIEQQHSADDGKYVPIEYYQGIFDILKTATGLGIHCVAAAGNGYANLDDPAYGGAFDLHRRDSGCVIVGAGGAPGQSEHLQRLDFSDYGSRVDAFGYGESVVTTGYGDLYAGTGDAHDVSSYTKDFNGTSSATPIVAGAMASVLGAAKAKGISISPQQLREALRKTGTPQAGKTEEHIGHLPDLKQLLNQL